jgi:hypothetical protein
VLSLEYSISSEIILAKYASSFIDFAASQTMSEAKRLSQNKENFKREQKSPMSVASVVWR